jgi:hypothetical protein
MSAKSAILKVAAVATVFVATASVTTGLASASVRPDNLPASAAWIVTNQESGYYLWRSTVSGWWETFIGTYNTIYSTGTSNGVQWLQDTNNQANGVYGECLTVDSANNWIYDKPCISTTVSQRWSASESGGWWILKNQYTGSDKCLGEGPDPSHDSVGMQPCDGSARQNWSFSQIYAYMHPHHGYFQISG